MDGLGTGPLDDLEDLLGVEVTLRGRLPAEGIGLVGQPGVQRVAVEVGVHGDGANAQLLAGADDTDSDLAPVGDQDLGEHGANLRCGVVAAETPSLGARARAALGGTRFADVRWVASTGSTNSDAMALARDGAPEGIVLLAESQTAGRGRLGRTWQAPPGSSLLLSVLLRPPAAVADAVTMVAGLAMAEAVAGVAGVQARLKWPNDLVVAVDGADRKLAGILAEADWPARSTISGGWAAPAPTERVVVVVGIGVNVNWPAEVPADLADLLTSCNHLAGREIDREELLVAFLRRLDQRYGALRADDSGSDGRAALRADWRARSATLGRQVRVELGADEVEGVAVDIDDAGRLVLDTLDGGRRTIAVGDVTHLRLSEG